MTDPTRREPPVPHPAYRRLSRPGPDGGPAPGPDPHAAPGPLPGPLPGSRAGGPAAGRCGAPAAPPGRTEVCQHCDAPRTCCQCRADIGDLRRFARRMAELHQRTGTPVCGCGTHRCYVRLRLDDIGHEGTP